METNEPLPPAERVEMPSDVYEALKAAVTVELSEQKAAETVNDLLAHPWLMDWIVGRSMTAVEKQGMLLDGLEASVADVITRVVTEILPEAPQEGPSAGERFGDSAGDRQPRHPRPGVGSGGVALNAVVETAVTEAHGGRRTEAPLDLP